MRDPQEKISYMIRDRNQTFEAVVPHSRKFTALEMYNMVHGTPELLFVTADKYLVYAAENRNVKTNMVNELATLLSMEEGSSLIITGDVVLVHPAHTDHQELEAC